MGRLVGAGVGARWPRAPPDGMDGGLEVSWSLMISKFVDGNDTPVPLDLALVRAVLEPHDVGDPHLTESENGSLGFWIRAPDGSETDIFVDEQGIQVRRPRPEPYGTSSRTWSPDSERSSSTRAEPRSYAERKNTHTFRRPCATTPQ